MRTSRFVICGLAAGVFLLPLAAETKPDFSGVWKLNLKSEGRGGPTNIVFKIDHKDPVFKYSATGLTPDGQPFTEQVEFTTDGKERPGPHSGKVSANWEENGVSIRFVISGNEYKVALRLSSDRKQMFREILGHREVYDKQ